MKVLVLGHRLQYEVQNLVGLFFPGERVETAFEKQPDWQVLTYLREGRGTTRLLALCRLGEGGETLRAHCAVAPGEPGHKQRCEMAFGELLYRLFSQVTGYRPKWGVLTGVRPVKNIRRRLDGGMGEADLRRLFCGEYRVSEQKFDLALQTARVQERALAPLPPAGPRDVSLYISIPFCPSRCLYCSFVSHSVEKTHKLVEPYLELLLQEISATFALVERLGLRLRTAYIGGGTPTILTAGQMDRLLGHLFSLVKTPLEEFTVEAGRPDTIDREKLRVMRQYPVSRININPQTLNDAVLERIGRRHTAAQTVESFCQAREAGFANINMDLIAGLPGDSYEGFVSTLDRVVALDPENVTVHTLSVKRAADLKSTAMVRYAAADAPVERMVDYAAATLGAAGYDPYYLYRQKNTLANLENVGYAKPGSEGLYNIYMMEELHTILGCGAGSVTKLVGRGTRPIERSFNYKYPQEYIRQFATVLERKGSLEEFYGCLSEAEHPAV